ncbi:MULTISPECIES: type VI secretion system baseplate subunit TssE [Rhodanobacteraceae]|uniref:type VI secretion system baseplate subunit TssE n=1 Tax=Rhodanobacteraceae TaxID=1775411 RepID=UPI00087FB22F|nr:MULTISPECIES: type VI secretion system baseplate subunit TssE [Rhodanobacteraceae]SDG88707.1 Gene 25-like lysozyme [Dyella sp. 333MFSha]SKB78160.1 Gene 25-like lysozyme [Luteibacter sp. 22Crub2.1]
MKELRVTASLLDRLLGDEAEPGSPGEVGAAAYIASAIRDVEDLLNTRNVHRQIVLDTADDASEVDESEVSAADSSLSLVASSAFMLGMPDFSVLSLANAKDREYLSNEIRHTIETFDRRFTSVDVVISDNHGASGSLDFVIRARLKVADLLEPVGLEARYQSSTMRFAVAEPVPRRSLPGYGGARQEASR